MHDGRGQFDVAHAFAADAAVRHLDAAAVADHALVLHAAVLAAGALPIFLRPKNPLAEQAVLLRTIGPIVNRLRLLDFAKGPGADVVWAGQADAHRPIVINTIIVNVTVTHAWPPRLQGLKYLFLKRVMDVWPQSQPAPLLALPKKHKSMTPSRLARHSGRCRRS